MHRMFVLFSLAGISAIVATPAPAQGPVPAPSHAFFEPASTPSVPVEAMLPGIVEPTQLVTLSARRDGALLHLSVREGDLVEANEILAVTDNREAVAALHVSEIAASVTANIDLARNELAMAQRHRQRVTQLFKHQAVSEVEIDQATADVHKAEAALKQAAEQQQLAACQKELEVVRLESYNLRAPFTGRVLKVVGKLGQSLARVDPVLTLASMKRLRKTAAGRHLLAGGLGPGWSDPVGNPRLLRTGDRRRDADVSLRVRNRQRRRTPPRRVHRASGQVAHASHSLRKVGAVGHQFRRRFAIGVVSG